MAQWITGEWPAACEVTGAELKKTYTRAHKALTAGVRPVAKKQGPPHLVLTIGAPGSGKSTVARAVCARRHPGRDYVILDFDRILQFHPRASEPVETLDIYGEATGVGVTSTFQHCLEEVLGAISGLAGELIVQKKFNLIYQVGSGHHQHLVRAKRLGYTTTLMFVGAPLALQQERSWARARRTGQFFGDDRAEHDEFVAGQREASASDAPWFALWADEFLAVGNSEPLPVAGPEARPLAERPPSGVHEAPPPGGHSLDDWLARARELVRRVCPPEAAGGARRAEPLPAPPLRWIGRSAATEGLKLSPGETKELEERLPGELARGHAPAAARRAAPPQTIYTMGAPGAGKSTISELYARRLSTAGAGPGPARDFISLDLDSAVKYHPRMKGIYMLPDLGGRPTGVALTTLHLAANYELEKVLHPTVNRLCAEGYDLLLNRVGVGGARVAKAHGHRTTLLYVGAPLPAAQARAQARALETGRFLSPTLAAQDRLVEEMWERDAQLAPWYALWVDEFLVASGSGSAPEASLASLRRVPARAPGEPLGDFIARAQAAVDEATGLGAGGRKKRARAFEAGQGHLPD